MTRSRAFLIRTDDLRTFEALLKQRIGEALDKAMRAEAERMLQKHVRGSGIKKPRGLLKATRARKRKRRRSP